MKGAAFLAFPASTLAGSVLWSGIFNSSYTVADFDECMIPTVNRIILYGTEY